MLLKPKKAKKKEQKIWKKKGKIKMNNYKNYNSNKVGSTQIAAAKTVDLVQYLLHNYPHLIRYNEKS